MANRNFNKQVTHAMPSSGHPTGQSGGTIPKIVEKTAAWPGVPGKTQPRARDKKGTRKVKTTMRSEGC